MVRIARLELLAEVLDIAGYREKKIRMLLGRINVLTLDGAAWLMVWDGIEVKKITPGIARVRRVGRVFGQNR